MTRARKQISALLVLVIAAIAVAFHTTPASAEPSIDSVKKKVDRLYAQAEKASERYNNANLVLKSSQLRLQALEADQARQQAVVDGLKHDVAALVVSQYQGHALSTASQVVLSDNPAAFVSNLNAVSSYNTQRSQVIDDYTIQVERLQLRQKAAEEQVASLAKIEKQMLADKKEIKARADKAKALLSKLEAAQIAALAAGDPSLPNVPVSGRVAKVIDFLRHQVGKAYVWGATGPNAYDCSGLTMMAWAQAGVSLPHSSRAQMGSGTPVAKSDLKPGDLVFYYSPVHHVGIYIGNGLIINAENPSVGVRVSGLDSMPYSGAVRP